MFKSKTHVVFKDKLGSDTEYVMPINEIRLMKYQIKASGEHRYHVLSDEDQQDIEITEAEYNRLKKFLT